MCLLPSAAYFWVINRSEIMQDLWMLKIRRDVSVAERHKSPEVTRAAAEASIAGSLK